jgi:hypothetical protein
MAYLGAVQHNDNDHESLSIALPQQPHDIEATHDQSVDDDDDTMLSYTSNSRSPPVDHNILHGGASTTSVTSSHMSMKGGGGSGLGSTHLHGLDLLSNSPISPMNSASTPYANATTPAPHHGKQCLIIIRCCCTEL